MSIKGIPITLYTETVTGYDDFNREIVETQAVEIPNVVIGQPSSEDITSEVNLSGKKAVYNLAIPADDTHDWKNKVVEFYGKKWRTIGVPTQFMDGYMGESWPWNKQIKVEEYE